MARTSSARPSRQLKLATDFTNMIATNDFFLLIILFIRIADMSSTVIDHSLLPMTIKFDSIIEANLIDHYLKIFLIYSCTFSQIVYQAVFKRELKNFDS